MSVDRIRAIRRPLVALVIVLLASFIAVPTLAADPPAPGKPDKAARPPATPLTVSGVVRASTDASGVTSYTVRSGGTTYTLEAGPSWFFGDKHPLKRFVGMDVTIAGERRPGSNEVRVDTVDGAALRSAGKPPWAGGWKAVGAAHPGWTQEKADRWQAKLNAKKERFGVDCWPPGHCTKAPRP